MTLERLLIAAALCLPGTALASAQGEKDDLLALLDEQTALATKTRLNTDYVPGMMSVLHGADLELRGVGTVWEALALVPGIERAMESTGRRRLLVRGVGNAWASGNVKLLLNDVAMNTAERGLADPLFNIPIEQVERIEVIRGPGSAVHGEYAYLGVVNVVTRRDSARIFAFGGSNSTIGNGAVAAWHEGDVWVSASMSGWRTDGHGAVSGPDALWPDDVASSYAPGHSNEAVDARTGVITLATAGASLLLQWTEDGLGDHFGLNDALPPQDEHVVERNRHRTVEGRKSLSFGAQVNSEIYLGWQDSAVSTDGMYVGPGPTFNPANPPGTNVFTAGEYLESRWYGGADIRWRPDVHHQVLLGLQYTDIEVRENEKRFNLRPSDDTVTDDYLVWENIAGAKLGTHRRIASVSLQDEFRAAEDFTLTTGLRYDDYSDTGARTSPRLAGVWRLGERNIIKGQYAEAFRPQTLYELAAEGYSSFGPLEPETVRTYELEYIRKGMRWDSKLTAFYSKLNDLITFVETDTALGFTNLDGETWGLEWEYRQQLSARLAVDGNVSYLETRDEANGRSLPGAPQWLANLGATYRRPSGLVWGVQIHHTGSVARHTNDPRGDLGDCTTLDVTATFTRRMLAGATWSVGVKNALDEEVRYASKPAYPDDYPRAGREWWTRVTYEF